MYFFTKNLKRFSRTPRLVYKHPGAPNLPAFIFINQDLRFGKSFWTSLQLTKNSKKFFREIDWFQEFSGDHSEGSNRTVLFTQKWSFCVFCTRIFRFKCPNNIKGEVDQSWNYSSGNSGIIQTTSISEVQNVPIESIGISWLQSGFLWDTFLIVP